MEENNISKTDTLTPIDLNRKTSSYFLVALLIVILAGAISYFVFFKNIIPLKFITKKSPTTIEKPQITILTKKYILDNEVGIQIYLSSNTGNTEVSAFQMKFTLPEDTNKEDVSITINPNLETQAWKFPIARFEEENGVSEIKLSGFRLGNSPFVVKGNLLLATVSTKNNKDLTLTLNTNDTLLFSSDAVTNIIFDSISE